MYKKGWNSQKGWEPPKSWDSQKGWEPPKSWESQMGWDSHKTCPPEHCDEADTKRVDCNSFGYNYYPTALIPIVLSDVELQALVESEITLPTPAKEIKNIRRNVSITQCKAIPSVLTPYEVKVFVTGKIHKNIQYVEECSGYVRDYSVNVPFSCNHSVYVSRTVKERFSKKSTLTNERIFIDDIGHGADNSQTGGRSFEWFNEPIECKLVFSAVNDLDLHKNIDGSGRFTKIIEKAEVVLLFLLLQSQQVPYYSHFGADCDQKGEAGHYAKKPAKPQIQGMNEQTIEERIKTILKRIKNME